MNDIQTKEEAIAFVAAVLRSRLSLLSQSFKDAMDLSRRFDISAADVLAFCKERAKHT